VLRINGRQVVDGVDHAQGVVDHVTKHGEILVIEGGVVANAEEPLAGGPQRVGGEREGAPGVGEARFGADGCVGLDALGVVRKLATLLGVAVS